MEQRSSIPERCLPRVAPPLPISLKWRGSWLTHHAWLHLPMSSHDVSVSFLPLQRRTPPKNPHLPPPASSGRAGRWARQYECPLDSGTWLLHPQPQSHQPWPTSPQLPLCLIHHPLCESSLPAAPCYLSTCKNQHSYIMSWGCRPGVVPSCNVSIWKMEYNSTFL